MVESEIPKEIKIHIYNFTETFSNWKRGNCIVHSTFLIFQDTCISSEKNHRFKSQNSKYGESIFSVQKLGLLNQNCLMYCWLNKKTPYKKFSNFKNEAKEKQIKITYCILTITAWVVPPTVLSVERRGRWRLGTGQHGDGCQRQIYLRSRESVVWGFDNYERSTQNILRETNLPETM